MAIQTPLQSDTLTIRAAQGTLSFLVTDEDGQPTYYPYVVKSEMSMAANLREAFREQPWLQKKYGSTRLLVNSPVVLVPNNDYYQTRDFDVEDMYSSVMTGHEGEEKIVEQLHELETMAIFAVNGDLKLVVTDNCSDVTVSNVMSSVWQHLCRRYFQYGERRRVFAYFHDRQVDICSFEQRRFHFANVFDAQNAHDALYYLLYVWKQLGMDQKNDELFTVGDMPQSDWLGEQLQRYIKHTQTINPTVTLNRSPKASIQGMAFDMMI